jgi:hypothetical protein
MMNLILSLLFMWLISALALQIGIALANARLDTIETTIGTAPILRIRTGAPPANCAAANAGTVLSTITLPSDWMAAHFRIHDSGDTVCHMQGTVTATGGGGDLTVDNAVFAVGQVFTITAFTLTEANA